MTITEIVTTMTERLSINMKAINSFCRTMNEETRETMITYFNASISSINKMRDEMCKITGLEHAEDIDTLPDKLRYNFHVFEKEFENWMNGLEECPSYGFPETITILSRAMDGCIEQYDKAVYFYGDQMKD